MTRAKLILGMFAAALLCASCATYNTFPQARVGKVNEPADLNNLIKDGKTGENGEYVIVDVRPVKKYAEAHIPTAINIPNGKIEEGDEKAPDKDKYIIVYCETGGRAQMAAKKMAKVGYANIFNWGGFDGWPFETESSPELMEQDESKDKAEKKAEKKSKKAEKDDDEDEADAESAESDKSEESEESDDFLDGL